MTLVYKEDVETVERLLSEYAGPGPNFDRAVQEFAKIISGFRPDPQVPPRRVVDEGEIPTLHGDDVFYILGRGTVVTMNLLNTPISQVDTGDHVKFDDTTVTLGTQEPAPCVTPGMVYVVTGVERHASRHPGPLVGLLVREVGYEL